LPYTVLDVELTTGVVRPLTITQSGSRLVLGDGPDVVGALVSEMGTPAEPMLGQLYLAPSTESGLAHDADPAETGFQGQITLTIETGSGPTAEQHTVIVDVTAGYSGSGAGAVAAGDVLAALRTQQRLNYLGFGDSAGDALAPTNVFDLPTQEALQLFRAAVDQEGDLAPADADTGLGATTLEWLNASAAPRWTSLAGLATAESYGTSWLTDTVGQAVDAVAGVTLSDVVGLSTEDGWSSADSRIPSDPGRLHQAGMEVDFAVPAGAQTASEPPGDPMTAEEQRLFDLVVQLHDIGSASHGLELIEVALSNTKVVAAISADPGLSGVSAHTGTESAAVMHVGFRAPEPGVISATHESYLLETLDGLADLGTALMTDGRFDWEIPLLAEDQGPDDPSLPRTLGNIFDLGQLIRDGVYQPVSDYFAAAPTPTAGDLVSHLAGLAGFGSVAEAAGNSAERIAFTFHYGAEAAEVLDLELGAEISEAGVILDAAAQLGVTAAFGFDVTVGVDLGRGVTASEAGFIQIGSFLIEADVTAADLDFAAGVGFLNAAVEDGQFLLDADLVTTVGGGAEMSLSDITSTPVGSLVALTPTGSVDVTLPITATIGTWTTPGGMDQPQIVIEDTDLFDGPGGGFQFDPIIDFDLPDGLMSFTEISPAAMVGVFGQLSQWLTDFQASPLLDAEIPFASGATLGGVMGLDTTLIDDVINLLESEPNVPAFASAQALAALIPGITSIEYDDAFAGLGGAPVLTYTFDLSKSFDPLIATVDLDLLGDNPLSGLANITTSSTITLTPDVNMGFKLRIDLTPQGEGVMVHVAQTLDEVTGRSLQNPAKVWDDYAEDDGLNDVTVTLRSGTTFGVNFDSLSGTSTLGGAIALLAGANPHFGVTLDTERKRLILTDTSTPAGADPEFRVAAANGSLAPFILGILGNDTDEDGEIVGGALHGDVLDNHLFIDEASFEASVDLSAPDIDASANFGLIELAIENGSGAIDTTVTVQLNDPGTGTPGPVSVGELFKGLSGLGSPGSNLVTLGLDASASLVLPISISSSLPGLDGLVGASPRIVIDWPTVFTTDPVGLDLDSFDITFEDFDDLLNFRDLGTDDVVDLLAAVAGLVADISGHSVLDIKMPVIDKTPGELLGFTQDFADTVAEFQANPDLLLDGLETALATALGLGVDLALDLSGPDPALRLNLDYTKDIPGGFQLPMNFDLGSLGLDGVSHLIDISSGGLLSVEGGVTFGLSLGLDPVSYTHLTLPTSDLV